MYIPVCGPCILQPAVFSAALLSSSQTFTMASVSSLQYASRFRLAVLEHLYPEGGAVAVFDDPFTDMDPVRVQEACRLIRKFSEKNQVIFVTCDGKYRELLGGNVLSMDPA